MSQCSKSCLLNGGDCVGMTDAQFKSFVLTQIKSWKEVLETATISGDAKTIKKVEEQIALLERMIEF